MEEELENLLTYFGAASFPDTPFWMNRYMLVHEPTSIINKLEKNIRDTKISSAAKEQLLVQLRELKHCCETGPFIK